MDFNKLLSTYSNNIDTAERSNEFAQNTPMPADILQKVKDFIRDFDSNKSPDDIMENNDEGEGTPDPIAEPSEAPVPNDILDALSQLDQPIGLSINDSDENVPNEIDTEVTENELENFDDDLNDDPDNLDDEIVESDADLDDEIENFEEDLNNELGEDLDNEVTESDESIENNDELEEALNDDLDNLDTEIDESDDGIDIGDFVNNFDDDDSVENFNDFDEEIEGSVFTEEISDPILNESDEFDIELPEEFGEEIAEEAEEEEEEEEEEPVEEEALEVPDFSNTELEANPFEVPATDLEIPTSYEEINKSLNFDIWDKQGKGVPSVELALTQEQSYKVRYKINSFVSKDLRFKIREIIADPESYPEIYKKLMSLLLIDVPEDVIQDLLAQLSNPDIADNYQLSETHTNRSIFHAQDVADYQESIQHLKTEFLYNIKKYSLYGLVVLLSGIIAWFGFAQPMRINSIFSKGLIEIQKDNYIEGEALFQQANTIAGQPVAEWFVKYADVYNSKNLITAAEKKYLSALAIEPQNITIATNVSGFYTNLGPQYYSNAIAVITKLTTYHPKKFEVWDDLGSLFINYSDFFIDNRDQQTELLYEAADVYRQYIEKNPKDPAPYYRMVDIYIRIGNKEQVDKISQLITELNPKFINLSIMNQLAKYYTDQRELTKSEQVLRKITPMLDQYYNNVPELQKIMNQYYNIDPLEISNILSSSYYEFARYKMLSYDIKSSGVLLTNSISFNPEHGDNYNLLGELYLYSPSHKSDKLIQAKKLFDQALAINPENYKAHINLGHMYYMWDNELGDLGQAHDTAAFHYRIAKSMMPNSVKNTLLSYNYGWLEYQNDNPEEAIDSWSEIYKDTPSNPVLSYALGSAFYKIGNPQLAQMELTKAADTFQVLKDKIPQPDLSNKRHTEIYTQLAKTYNNLGVINANYGVANATRKDYFDSQALLNFYSAQDISDQLNTIYSTTEYNIGVITRPNIRDRQTIFDDAIPKQTSIENPKSEFNRLLLQNI